MENEQLITWYDFFHQSESGKVNYCSLPLATSAGVEASPQS
jgi:hypothetical protein